MGWGCDTKSVCCVIEQIDENPRGSVQGVCNTPHHAVTERTDFVLRDGWDSLELFEGGELADEWAGVFEEGGCHVVVCVVDPFVGHVANLAADLGDVGFKEVFDDVVSDAAHTDRAALSESTSELDSFLSDFAGFSLVDFGDATHKGALEVAKGIAANALELEFFADQGDECICECASAEAGMAEGVAGDFLALLFKDAHDHRLGFAFVVDLAPDAFAEGDDAASVLVVHTAHILEEVVDDELLFGNIDQMGAIVGITACKCGGCGQKARATAHDDGEINAGERAVVEVGASEGLGNKAGSRAKAGRVVGDGQIVVDGFGDVDGAHLVLGFLCVFADDLDGFGRVVSADIKEKSDVAGFELFKELLTIGRVGFVARGKQGSRGGLCDGFEVCVCCCTQVDQVAVAQSAHAMKRPVDLLDLWVSCGFEDCPNKALVDDSCGATPLRDDHIPFKDRHVAPPNRLWRNWSFTRQERRRACITRSMCASSHVHKARRVRQRSLCGCG